MDTLFQDIKYALRSLRRTPGFTLTVIAVMALGIGVNSMIYTVVHGTLLADLPFPDVQRMVRVKIQSPREKNPITMSMADTRDVMDHVSSLRATSAWDEVSAFFAAGDEPQRYQGTLATYGLAAALGITPQKGRWFTPEECRVGAAYVPVVLSGKLWREAFHSDPHILGRTLHVNGRPRTVVGVMPESFRFPETSDVFMPMATNDTSDSRGAHYLNVVARLAPGRTRAQAQAELDALSRQLAHDYKATNDRMRIVALDFRDDMVADVRLQMIMLSLAVTFVLLIACANVANLLLARGTARQREVGVRIALGASRTRLTRQLLTESLLLALAGGAIGLVLGDWGMRVTVASIPEPLPYWMKFQLDPMVFLAVLGVTLFAGFAFGLAPALQATSGDVLTPLREGSAGSGESRARHRMRGTLVVTEIALAVLLLIGSGLMIRSFLWQTEQRAALRTHGVLTGSLLLPVALYKDDAARIAFFREFRDALRSLPGVTAVGGVANLHLGTGQWRTSVQREGIDADDQPESRSPLVSFNIVTPGYFEAVGMQLIAGRDFTDADGANAPRVAIVNTVAARTLWPNQDPIGKRWRGDKNDPHGWATVVGVVSSVRQHVRSGDDALGEVIVPQAQFGNQTLTWAIRTSGPAAALAAPVRRLLRDRDPNLVFADARTFDEQLRRAVWEPRVYAQLFAVFSFVALVIAALGIYGVMAYSVAQRTREIGIRMALGAARADVQRLVVGQALRLTLLGSGLGLAAAFALTRFMQSQLHGVRADDPPTFVGVTLILALSSAAAAWLPTARAVRVDPVVALRHE